MLRIKIKNIYSWRYFHSNYYPQLFINGVGIERDRGDKISSIFCCWILAPLAKAIRQTSRVRVHQTRWTLPEKTKLITLSGFVSNKEGVEQKSSSPWEFQLVNTLLSSVLLKSFTANNCPDINRLTVRWGLVVRSASPAVPAVWHWGGCRFQHSHHFYTLKLSLYKLCIILCSKNEPNPVF